MAWARVWRFNGKTVFAAKCATCHSGADFTDSATSRLNNVGTLKPSSGKRLGAALTGLDTPTLRDVWATAPYLHDGSAETVEDAVRAHTTLTLTEADVLSVSALTYNESAALNLVAGQLYPIRIEFYEATGWAVTRLQWKTPGAADYAATPAARLHAN